MFLKVLRADLVLKWQDFKQIQTQGVLSNHDHSTSRGVFRLVESQRFAIDGNKEILAIEMRAGTKSDPIRRFVQRAIVSRYAADDFSGIKDVGSWVLNPDDYEHTTPLALTKRFGVSPSEARRFIKALDNLEFEKKGLSQTLDLNYVLPLWQWEQAPFLSPNKKKAVSNLTKTFIKTVANLDNPDFSSFRAAMQDWTRSSRLSYDIEEYLKPKPHAKKALKDLIEYPVIEGHVDVNKIDYGIEYSARFPIQTSADFIEIQGANKSPEWIRTHYDYTPKERTEALKRVARALSRELNGGQSNISRLASDGHGHKLDIAYEIKDKNNRKWRVEWDGIGRSYGLDGNIAEGSPRGGHIEIVTPKFTPEPEDINKLYKALKSEGLVASSRFGGGHINIDLKPFEGRPDKMARFIGTYLENRKMMSLLFQDPHRQMSAEAIDVSDNLVRNLKNFNGSEDDLKKLLYEEKFFNTRTGRKTRNTQLNLLAYFQDVIPQEFIHQNFDMKNDLWRRTFNVDPKIRKMEFRMFNAPRNSIESVLQIKFTKALMDRALNGRDDVFKDIPKVDYEDYVNNPDRAFSDFNKTMSKLKLDPEEYRSFFLEGLETAKKIKAVNGYEAMRQKQSHYPKVTNWKRAVEARSSETAIGSKGRFWDGNDVLVEAKLFKQKQLIRTELREQARKKTALKGHLTRELRPTISKCGFNLG